METHEDHINDTLTSSDISSIKKNITKECLLVLKVIYDTPGIQQKTLSEKLNKKPNTLSNLIRKIKASKITLLQTDKRGTQHYYSLTDIAKRIVEQDLLKDTQPPESSEAAHSKNTEAITAKVVKNINLFKIECGSSMPSILDDLMNGKENPDITSEIKKIYNDLLEPLYNLRRQNDAVLQQVFDTLEDESLADQFRKYLNKKFIYFDFLKPLLASATLDNITRFKIIDNIFSEIHPSIFVPYQTEEWLEPQLTSGEHNNLLLGILKLSNEFLDNHYSKSTAVMKWKAYFISEELAFYIAEKCSVLMYLHRIVTTP